MEGEEKPKLGGPNAAPQGTQIYIFLQLKHLNKNVEAYQKLGYNSWLKMKKLPTGFLQHNKNKYKYRRGS